MPLLIGLLALFMPRLVVALLLLFTQWFSGIFDSLLWLILGFIFLPTTLLWYTAVQHWFGGQLDDLAYRGDGDRPIDRHSPAGSRRRD